MMAYNIIVYPPYSFIIKDEEYGYDYLRINFLDVADKLTDGDTLEIVRRMREVLKCYIEDMEEKACSSS